MSTESMRTSRRRVKQLAELRAQIAKWREFWHKPYVLDTIPSIEVRKIFDELAELAAEESA